MGSPPSLLDENARRELLALARATLDQYFHAGKAPEYKPRNPGLSNRGGAFVSLHKGEQLRGCIGLIAGEGELYRTVQRCALSAALEDGRFQPVTAQEVAGLNIEISILSPLERIQDPSVIEVGRHGLMISLGAMRGLLLPQVAAKYQWDRETFLSQTCRKAGLPPDAWRSDKAVLQTFEAQVFSDHTG
jgi:AmmeMemoRadiSam system protein A